MSPKKMIDSINILIVEDNRLDAELMIEILTLAGFKVNYACVESEEEYIKYLNPDIDVVLSDYSLPQFDGIKALEILKQKKLDIPFILISGEIGEELAVKAIKLGASDFLMKAHVNNLPKTIERETTEARLRRELKQTEEHYHRLVDYSPDGILIHSGGTIVFVNPAICKLLAVHDPSKLIGKSVLDVIHPDFHDIAKKRMDIMINQKIPVPMIDEKFIRLDGFIIDVEVSAAPIVYLETPSIQMFIRDITVRKRAEQALELQNLKLKKLVRKMKKLRLADVMKSQFLATMSHELRTPLNAIIGFSEMLKDGILGQLTTKQASYCQDIYDSGRHLLLLINDILDLSKIESGAMKPELERCNIKELLSESLKVVRTRAKANNIECSYKPDPNLEVAYLDSKKVKQIIYNMLDNAYKFTKEGGKITLSSSVESDKNILKISVQDTGVGIQPEDLDKLFKPFTQIAEAQFKHQKGTGLGLVMMKNLAELQSGKIVVDSKFQEGSTFTLVIPYITELNEPGLEKPGLISPITKESPVALVIEDDDSSAELISMQLKQLNIKVKRVSTAEVGIKLAKNQTIDLIILDILLPGINGWELLDTIKRDEDLKHIPVIIVSIIADEQQGFALGAVEVLQKPLGRFDLINALQKYIKNSKTEKSFKVMAIDDDPSVLTMIETYLKEMSCEVMSVSTGQEALDAIDFKKPDLIILDLMMPGMTGFEVVDYLKNNPETAEIPVLILSSKNITEEEKQKLEADVVKIIRKGAVLENNFQNEIRRIIPH